MLVLTPIGQSMRFLIVLTPTGVVLPGLTPTGQNLICFYFSSHLLVRIRVFLVVLTPLLDKNLFFISVLIPTGQNQSFSTCPDTYWSESKFFCQSSHILVWIRVFLLVLTPTGQNLSFSACPHTYCSEYEFLYFSSHLLFIIWVLLLVLTPTGQNLSCSACPQIYWSESKLFWLVRIWVFMRLLTLIVHNMSSSACPHTF